MTSPDLSHLGPQDAVVAFRSFPRRYGAELTGIQGDDLPDELAVRIGPEGESALQIVSDVTRTWAVIGAALAQVVRTDDPVLHPAIADPSQRQWDTPAPDTIDDALVLLGHEADALADQIGHVLSATDWNRTGAIAGGGTITALELVKEAVRVGADGLTRVRATLAAVSR